MMSDEDQEAQRQRAERLRQEIERLKTGNGASEGETTPERRPDESPNEYVNRRMREIARKKRERS